MRFLVTGATGKVGNALARRLAKRGDEVVALVRDAARARELLPPGVELAVGDVTEAESVRRAADGVDGAFNCMGIFEQWVPDPRSFERVNAEGARNVVIAAREGGARRVVHTSTFDVFAADRGGTVRETALLRWEARADSSKAREELGVEFTPWREGIRRTVAWMLETGRI
jgi:dihydroflavonol-4-reductase